MQACGATRDPVQDKGWECNGTGLVIVATVSYGGHRVPVVLPSRALEVHRPESWWDDPVLPFAGGDHFHLVIPRRPVPDSFVPNATMTRGDTVTPVRFSGLREDFTHWLEVGPTSDGAALHFGSPA